MQPRSTRLNQANREKFKRAVMADKLPPEGRPDTSLFQKNWQNKIYDIAYGEHKDLLAKMPDWMVEIEDTIRVSIPHQQRVIQMSFQLPKKVRLPSG
jgi:hypothetical protein